ncbi:MAG: DUF2931 family protein [Gammaproteobacteria bacterium]|nr:DUF2931 family protein [Gammaproteobacteria bacterium]
MTKFEWQATESGPRYYPMEIIAGSLKYHDGSGSTYVPNGVTLHHGWGRGVSSHVLGDGKRKNPLPSQLAIQFFSYTENQFYVGDFALPYEKILALFQAGFYSHSQKEWVTYHSIIVGVSPSGGVTVWLWAYEKITEVFFGRAEKTDIPWSRLTTAIKISREEFVRLEVEDSLKTPERIEALRKNGIPLDLWENYRIRYDWRPLFTGMTLRDPRLHTKYFNGEQGFLEYPAEKGAAVLTHAVPREIGIYWKNPAPDGRNQQFDFTFDETEIMAVFKTLSKHQLPITLEFSMRREEGKRMIFFIVHTEKETISLKKVGFRSYLAKD